MKPQIYTNCSNFGGIFGDELSLLFKEGVHITIASGYTSHSIIQKYKSDLVNIAKNGGDVTLLIGMGIFEGLRKATYDKLDDLNRDLLIANPNCKGVKFVWNPPPFHGKIYRIKTKNESFYFAGSSNFSQTGLFQNLEFTCPITDSELIIKTDNYLEWLLDDTKSVNLSKCESFPIIENLTNDKIQKQRIKISNQKISLTSNLPYLDISLNRVDQQHKSNLNIFFGAGRLNRKKGTVAPRDWYEVEIIVDMPTTKNQIYPRGDFTVYTDDGLVFPCKTSGDYYKNFRSRDDLKVLGQWIKGKLQNKGSLKLFEPVTSQTLNDYGKDYIRIYKLSNNEYYLEF